MNTAHHAVWPKRLPLAIDTPATALPDNLATSARRYPHRPALRCFGRVTTYAELAAQVDRLAAWLHAHGVQRGDRVLVGLQNSPQLVIAHYAVMRANAVVVPVNPMNRAAELAHLVADSGAVLAITSVDLAPEWLAAGLGAAALLLTTLGETFDRDHSEAQGLPEAWATWLWPDTAPPAGAHRWADALACPFPPPPLEVAADDLALLGYTSGTTGHPKGCMHRHASLQHNTVANALWGQAHEQDVTLAVVPMFHITGIVVILHTSIHAGGCLLLMPRWQRELAGALIKRHHVTRWTNIPTMVIDLLASPRAAEFDLASLVYIGGGGAAMPAAVSARLLAGWGLRYVEGYGLTETAGPCHSNPHDAPRPQCLGVPYFGVDARVIDPDSGAEVPRGEPGEIIVRGPMVFAGYWGRPEATAAAFIELGGQRYFRTGDMGRVDEAGYFFMTDRLKRMINASGFKVWPAEVETLMYAHPGVQDACVVAAPDAYRGETVKALIVKRAGFDALTEDELRTWCREHMAAYKVPALIEFMESLPRSGAGKVMWRVLQEREGAK